MQCSGKTFILVMQSLQTFFIYFYVYLLITDLIQNFTRFPKAFIDINTKITKRLYKQNVKSIIASNYNNNIGQLYYIYDLGINREKLLAKHLY